MLDEIDKKRLFASLKGQDRIFCLTNELFIEMAGMFESPSAEFLPKRAELLMRFLVKDFHFLKRCQDIIRNEIQGGKNIFVDIAKVENAILHLNAMTKGISYMPENLKYLIRNVNKEKEKQVVSIKKITENFRKKDTPDIEKENMYKYNFSIDICLSMAKELVKSQFFNVGTESESNKKFVEIYKNLFEYPYLKTLITVITEALHRYNFEDEYYGVGKGDKYDLMQLVYMVDVDWIISEEKGKFRYIFEKLFNLPKRFMNIEEFMAEVL